MKSRCYCESNISYYNYGARGIKVCERWHSFENFYEDMHAGFEDHLTLDRIDNDSDYSPENCRWATKDQQQKNKKTNRFFHINGKKLSLRETAKELGITYTSLRLRLSRKWNDNKIFSQKYNERIYSPFCPSGHEYTKSNTRLRFSKNKKWKYRECIQCGRDRYRRKRELLIQKGTSE